MYASVLLLLKAESDYCKILQFIEYRRRLIGGKGHAWGVGQGRGRETLAGYGTDLSGQSVCSPQAHTHAVVGHRCRPCKRPHAHADAFPRFVRRQECAGWQCGGQKQTFRRSRTRKLLSPWPSGPCGFRCASQQLHLRAGVAMCAILNMFRDSDRVGVLYLVL